MNRMNEFIVFSRRQYKVCEVGFMNQSRVEIWLGRESVHHQTGLGISMGVASFRKTQSGAV